MYLQRYNAIVGSEIKLVPLASISRSQEEKLFFKLGKGKGFRGTKRSLILILLDDVALSEGSPMVFSFVALWMEYY